MRTMENIADEMERMVWAAIEHHLIRQIEITEGRVPNNSEVSQFGSCQIWPDGRTIYTWRKVPIVSIEPGELGKPMPTIKVREL